MKEGTIFAVICFPEVWPPNNSIVLFEKNGTQIIGQIDGSLKLNIEHHVFYSQSIEFTKAKRALLFISWNESTGITVHINSEKLDSDENNVTLRVTSKEPINNLVKSFDNTDSKKACKEWVAWRKHHYGSAKQSPKQNRVLKSTEDQFEELNSAIESLVHHIVNFKEQNNLFLINALPLLRSLLFWGDAKAQNFSPLLFRIAGLLGSELPIYAFKNRLDEIAGNPLFENLSSVSIDNRPSTIQKWPNEVLMDFQEWLRSKIILKREGQDESFRWIDIIFEGANTNSASHFDEDSPVIIEELKGIIIFGQSQYYEYVIAATEITIELGRYLISKKNAAYRT